VVTAAEVVTIQRQRSYSIQTDAGTGDLQLWWYPATTGMPSTMVVAKSLPPTVGSTQYPFVPQPKVFPETDTVYVGMHLALSAPPNAAGSGTKRPGRNQLGSFYSE
jgi:hypothetical protein